jgi:phage terminase Nu1 subunit (DNA packaging protein)
MESTLYKVQHNKSYYAANKEKIAARKKQWYLENKEEINSKHREYHRLNRERINKKRQRRGTTDCEMLHERL